MGLLKHFFLPYCALVHTFMVVSVLVMDKRTELLQNLGVMDEEQEELTILEKHLLGIEAAFHASLLFGCVIGIVREDSHFRGVITIMEIIMPTLAAYDGWRYDLPYMVALGNAVLAFAALMIHIREPGIFTKDKTNKKKD